MNKHREKKALILFSVILGFLSNGSSAQEPAVVCRDKLLPPSRERLEHLLELQKSPLTLKVSFSKGPESVTQVHGVPPKARAVAVTNRVFRHYRAKGDRLAEWLKTSELRAGILPYVQISGIDGRFNYEDLCGVFMTTPDFKPQQVGLGKGEFDFVDFTLDEGTGVLEIEPGIFLVPGEADVADWIKVHYQKFKETGQKPNDLGLVEFFKVLDQRTSLEPSRVKIHPIP